MNIATLVAAVNICIAQRVVTFTTTLGASAQSVARHVDTRQNNADDCAGAGSTGVPACTNGACRAATGIGTESAQYQWPHQCAVFQQSEQQQIWQHHAL